MPSPFISHGAQGPGREQGKEDTRTPTHSEPILPLHITIHANGWFLRRYVHARAGLVARRACRRRGSRGELLRDIARAGGSRRIAGSAPKPPTRHLLDPRG